MSSSARCLVSLLILMLSKSNDDFFSKYITHLITDLPLPSEETAEKENNPKAPGRRAILLKSPAKPRTRFVSQASN